jgi:hypothetical protein
MAKKSSRTTKGARSQRRQTGHRSQPKSAGAAANPDNGTDNVLHAGAEQAGGEEPHPVAGPQFAEPDATPDPVEFKRKHASDKVAYQLLDRERQLPMGFPLSRGVPEPVLKLADIWGSAGASVEQRVKDNGQIVFHAVGDTGNTKGPKTQNAVADKMVSDFEEGDLKEIPKFFLHLGDVVYSFGEDAYYYDQFYDPYRNYPAPIIALAGNHDGMVAPSTDVPTLQALLENFCRSTFVITPEAGGLSRTAQIQPGVCSSPSRRRLCAFSRFTATPSKIPA